VLDYWFVPGVNSPTNHIQRLRMIKSPAEIELMRIAGEIASKSFHQVQLPCCYISLT